MNDDQDSEELIRDDLFWPWHVRCLKKHWPVVLIFLGLATAWVSYRTLTPVRAPEDSAHSLVITPEPVEALSTAALLPKNSAPLPALAPEPVEALSTAASLPQGRPLDTANPPTEALHPAFRPDAQLFPPLPPPKPGEWLHEFEVDPQSFTDYLSEQPNIPDERRRFIYLQPIGKFPSDGAPPLEVLSVYTEKFYGLPVKVLPALGQPDAKKVQRRINDHTQRQQLLTGDLLTMLHAQLPSDAFCVIGLTMSDLWPGDGWNFLFGQATFHERVGVYSFARYDPAFFGEKINERTRRALILKRSLMVMGHEIGHMFTIRHCTHHACNMGGANSLEEFDRHSMHLCPVCLRKLHHAVGFDPVKRYRGLRAFFRAHGMSEEAAWTARRLSALTTAQ